MRARHVRVVRIASTGVHYIDARRMRMSQSGSAIGLSGKDGRKYGNALRKSGNAVRVPAAMGTQAASNGGARIKVSRGRSPNTRR